HAVDTGSSVRPSCGAYGWVLPSRRGSGTLLGRWGSRHEAAGRSVQSRDQRCVITGWSPSRPRQLTMSRMVTTLEVFERIADGIAKPMMPEYCLALLRKTQLAWTTSVRQCTQR